jgi:hypothetical protein
MQAKTIKQIQEYIRKETGGCRLPLYKDHGYFYFWDSESSDSYSVYCTAIKHLSLEQWLQEYLEARDKFFLRSGDSRETSIQVMEAILVIARETNSDPVRIWEAPTSEEVQDVWRLATMNGYLNNDIGLYWGEDSLHTKKLYAD